MPAPLAAAVLLAVLPWSSGRIAVPRAYAARMTAHIAAIEARTWAEATPGDLYHGHLLMKAGAPTRFMTTEGMFRASVGVLYHADEQLRRWRLDDGDLPVRQRRPRSIVAYWTGEIVDAAALVADPLTLPHYEGHGTIHLDELAREHANLDIRRDRAVTAGDARCLTNQIVDFGGFPRRYTMECYPPR